MSTVVIPVGLPSEVDRERALSGSDLPVGRAEAQRADEQTLWRTIEVRHLAALLAVAEEGSFRRAADRLGYVQSAISNQIARLERAAGVRLIERASGSSTVQLTAAGHVLLGHTNEIIARLDAAYLDVSSLASQAAGTVRVAGLERFSPRRFARVLRCFRERYPRAQVVLDDGGSDALNLSRLVAGSVDMVVSELPTSDGPFSHLTLEHDSYVLLVADDSPLAARREPVTTAAIASLRLMIPSSCALSAADDASLHELGIEPRSLLRPDSVATAQALVEAGLGEAIVLRSQLTPRHGSVAIELPGLLPERTIALVYHSEREYSTVAHGFIRAVNVACEAERRSIDSLAA